MTHEERIDQILARLPMLPPDRAAVVRAKYMAEVTDEAEWHYLSFADDSLPTGKQWLGAVITRAHHFMDAHARTYELGINPGGEVIGCKALPVPPEYEDRLLNRADMEAVDGIWGGHGLTTLGALKETANE